MNLKAKNHYSLKQKKIQLTHNGEKHIFFSGIKIDSYKPYTPVDKYPNLTFKTILEVQTKDMCKTFNHSVKYADAVKLEYDNYNKKFIVALGKGLTGDVAEKIKYDIKINKVISEYEAMDYLSFPYIKKAFKSTYNNKVQIKFSSDYPLEVLYEPNNARHKILISPRMVDNWAENRFKTDKDKGKYYSSFTLQGDSNERRSIANGFIDFFKRGRCGCI